MKQRTPVSTIMTREVVTLNLNDNMELGRENCLKHETHSTHSYRHWQKGCRYAESY